MKYFRFLFIFFLVSIGVQSCKKLIHVDFPKNQITTGTIFKTEQNAIAVLSSVYYSLSTRVPGNISSLVNLYSDELNTTASDLSVMEFSQGYVSVTNLGNSNIWNSFYAVIYECNSILENIDASPGINITVQNQIKGEAFFIRSLCYFYLVNLYNEVPLLITTNVNITANQPKSPVTQIHSQIISDLILAKSLVSENNHNEGKVRANKHAVSALLARIYLYQKKWALAEDEASLVLESGAFGLVPSLSGVFIKNSKETILELWNKTGYSIVGPLFIPTPSSVPLFTVSESLLDGFESGDERKNLWIGNVDNASGLFYFPYKYKNRSVPAGNREEYTVILRLAEQYLIRAEARAQLNKLDDAQQDLNSIRTRAGLPALELNDKEDILTAIEKERRVELFGEWAHRFFDLKRYGHVNLLGSIKPAWKLTSEFLPLPQYEISNNSRLIQNPGY